MLNKFIRVCQTGDINLIKQILADSTFDPNGPPAGLIEACSRGWLEIVSLLLKDSRIDVNKEDNNGKTGFIHACENGHREIVSLLLQDSRIDVNKAAKNGWTGFIYSCEFGDEAAVSLLLTDPRVDVNTVDTDAATGFIHACKNCDTDIVSLLLNNSRIDTEQTDKNGKTGFLYACQTGDTDLISLLLKDPRMSIDNQFLGACYLGDTARISLLLNYSPVDVNKADPIGGITPFFVLFEQSNLQTASLLVRHSGGMHRIWWEMRVRFLCRKMIARRFLRKNDEFNKLLQLWTGIFTYIVIQHSYYYQTAVLRRSRTIWQKEISEESWREACDVMRENDTINILSLFFFYSPERDHYSSRPYRDNRAYRDLRDAFYPQIPYNDIEKAFR